MLKKRILLLAIFCFSMNACVLEFRYQDTEFQPDASSFHEKEPGPSQDTHLTCPEAPCSLGAVRCSQGNKVQTCLYGSDRCLNWQTTTTCHNNSICFENKCITICRQHQDCGSGQICQDGKCTSCQNTCLAGQSRCSPQDNQLEVCNQINGCFSWQKQPCPSNMACFNNGACILVCSQDTDCPAHHICFGGICQKCTTTCTEGEKTCLRSKVMTCENNNGCTLWSPSSCKPGFTCNEGKCIRACADASDCLTGERCIEGRCKKCESCQVNTTQCRGDGKRYICQNSLCPEWKPAFCPNNLICSAGNCTKKPCKQHGDCPTGELCTGGSCNPCQSNCTGSKSRCQSKKVEQCVSQNGCSTWQVTATCSAKQECKQNRCITPCKNDADCPSNMDCFKGYCEVKPWIRSVGGKHEDVATSVQVSKDGSIYIAGHFYRSISFGNASFSSKGDADFFVAKYGADGTPLWMKVFGGTKQDRATDMLLDKSGNIFLTGFFESRFSIGGTSFRPQQYSGAFLLKLNAEGSLLWGKQFVGELRASGQRIAIDSKGSILLTGEFSSTLQIGNTKHTNKKYKNIFVAKLNKDGVPIWSQDFGDTDEDNEGRGIAVDSQDNIYVVGSIRSDVTFGSQKLLLKGEKTRGFILKMDTNGKHLFAKTLMSICHHISVENQLVAVTGREGDGTLSYDASIIALKTDGTELWQKKYSSTLAEGFATQIDSQQNIYLTGLFYRSIQTDKTLTAVGFHDVFLIKYNASGQVLWSHSFGGRGYDQGNRVSFDLAGNVVLVGYFENKAQLGSKEISSQDDYDIFVFKLRSSGKLP